MKKISKIKLQNISQAEMNEKEMNNLRGGTICCICGCRGSGSTRENYNANIRGGATGKYSPGGGAGFGAFLSPQK